MIEKSALRIGNNFNAAGVAAKIYRWVQDNSQRGIDTDICLGIGLAESDVAARVWTVTLECNITGHDDLSTALDFEPDAADKLAAAFDALSQTAPCKCRRCREFFLGMGDLYKVASIARDHTLRRLDTEAATREHEEESGTNEFNAAPDWLSGMVSQLKETGLDIAIIGFEIPEPAPAATPSGEFWSVGVYRTRTVETAPKIYSVEGEVMPFGDAAALLPDGYALPYFSASQREAMQRAADLQKYLDAHPQQGPLGTGTVRLSARMFAGELPPTFGRS